MFVPVASAALSSGALGYALGLPMTYCAMVGGGSFFLSDRLADAVSGPGGSVMASAALGTLAGTAAAYGLVVNDPSYALAIGLASSAGGTAAAAYIGK
jgi:hypothetical protein